MLKECQELGPDELSQFFQEESFTEIEVLHFNRLYGLNDDALDTLRASNNRKLKNLELPNCGIYSVEAMCQFFLNAPITTNLQVLDFHKAKQINNDVIKAIADS